LLKLALNVKGEDSVAFAAGVLIVTAGADETETFTVALA
jgi:hypothetical protein